MSEVERLPYAWVVTTDTPGVVKLTFDPTEGRVTDELYRLRTTPTPHDCGVETPEAAVEAIPDGWVEIFAPLVRESYGVDAPSWGRTTEAARQRWRRSAANYIESRLIAQGWTPPGTEER